MDPVLPYRILSPGSRKQKFSHRVKDSKLSLKSRKGTYIDHGCKENRDPTLSTGKLQKRNGLRFEDSDLMTSDESDKSFEHYSQPNSVLSLNTQESTFSLPVAESTRCDFPSMKLTSESTIASLHTASNGSISSGNTEYFTAYPLPGGCDESIICISDSSPEPERKVASTKNRLPESVLISSDESDSEPSCALQRSNTVKKKLCETVDLESLMSDEDHSDDDVVIPPSVKSDQASIRSSVSSDVIQSQPDNDLIIHPSPDKSSQSEIMSEDSYCDKGSSKASAEKQVERHTSSTRVNGASCDEKASRSNPPPDCDLNESSWKEDFRLVLPDSQSFDSGKLKPMEVKTKVDTPSKMKNTISKEKYDDIARWIIRGRTTSESSLDSMNVPSSLVEKTKTKTSNDKTNQGSSQHGRSPAARRPSLSSDSDDDDKFQALIESVRKKRNETQKKNHVKEDSFIDDSFIDDGCGSDVAQSPSFDVYHSDLTKSIRTEVKSVKKTVQSIKKKKVFRNFYDSDESSDDAYTSPINKPKTRTKGVRKAIEYPSDSEDSITDFEMPIKGRKESDKQGFSDDSEAGSIDLDSGLRNLKVKSPSRNSVQPKSKVPNWRKAVNPPSSSSESSNSTSSKPDLPKKQTKKVQEKKPLKTSAVSAAVTPRNIAALKSPGRPYSPIRTFLTSLSGPTHEAGVRDHPEATVYNKNFKGKKEELTRRLFKLFNREVFDKRLPDDMLLEWNARLVRTAGLCYCKLIRKDGVTSRTAKIALSTKVITSPDRLRDTLIHEMCHAAVWLLNNVSGGHGPFWKAWAHKAMKRFPELPPIERCHTYNIETKFTYKCTKCGYSFGRHSKSLDLDKKRCGYCYGRFEVFLSSQVQGQNSQEKVMKTPRTPNAFALFVKENYGAVKQENNKMKHGDIMKKLSENFASMKVKL